MSNFSLIEAAGEVLEKYGGVKVGRRTALAVPAALGIAKALEKVAFADDRRPPTFVGADGRLYSIAPFKPGWGYILTGEDGVEIFDGNDIDNPDPQHYGGSFNLLLVGTDSVSVGFRERRCGGGIYWDILGDIEGGDYVTWGTNGWEFFRTEMEGRYTEQERIGRSQIGVIVSSDMLGRRAPLDLMRGSIDLGIRYPAQGCGPTGQQPAQPEVRPAKVCPTTWEWPGIFRASGVPSVGVTNIDIARSERGFNWRDFPSGMRAFFAEPGGLLVDRNKIPVGDLAQWDNIVRDSNGAVNFINPQNQQVFQSSTFEGSIPWKGYAMFSLEEGRLSIPDEDSCLIVDFFQQEPGVPGANNYLIVVKGRNGDQALGRTARWEGAVGGNALYQRYDRAAFVSADQLNQLSEESHRRSRRTTVVGLDLNTRAMMVAQQDRGSAAWRWVVANYTGV